MSTKKHQSPKGRGPSEPQNISQNYAITEDDTGKKIKLNLNVDYYDSYGNDVSVFFVNNPTYKPSEVFCFIFPLTAIEAFKEHNISMNDVYVLLTIAAQMEYYNECFSSHQKIADAIGVKRQSVTRSIFKLKQAGIVSTTKTGKSGKATLLVNWKVLAKGRLREFAKSSQDRADIFRAKAKFYSQEAQRYEQMAKDCEKAEGKEDADIPF